jgi:hypothetical protein
MPWKTADSNEVISILNNLTTMQDAVGKAKRDVQLKLKISSDWPDQLKATISNLIGNLAFIQQMGNDFEDTCITLIKGYEQDVG